MVLYAQTVARVRLQRFDHLDSTGGGVRLMFGTTPIELPLPMAVFSRLVAERAGMDRAAALGVFPGWPWSRPISGVSLLKRPLGVGHVDQCCPHRRHVPARC